MVRLSAVLAVLLAGAAGFAGGLSGRRAALVPSLPPGRHRPPELLAAHRALEAGEPASALDHLARLPIGLGAEDRAEAALVGALAREDLPAIYAVLREHPDSAAAARARWEILSRTPPGPRRDAMRRDFERRHPGAWVLGEGRTP
jgi:hypothetical protein